MKKEEFTALGISEELAEKAAEASKKELEGFIPQTRFNEVNEAKKQLEKDVSARDKQLEELKKSAGDNESLTKQIADLQAENKAAQEKYDADMMALKLSTAIKLAIGESAHDADLVAGQVDAGKLVLMEDGKVAGLEEQIKALKETKGFLFKDAGASETDKGQTAADKKKGYEPKGGKTDTTGYAKSIAEGLNQEVSENPYAKAWG